MTFEDRKLSVIFKDEDDLILIYRLDKEIYYTLVCELQYR